MILGKVWVTAIAPIVVIKPLLFFVKKYNVEVIKDMHMKEEKKVDLDEIRKTFQKLQEQIEKFEKNN
jgi:hypothetical protein